MHSVDTKSKIIVYIIYIYTVVALGLEDSTPYLKPKESKNHIYTFKCMNNLVVYFKYYSSKLNSIYVIQNNKCVVDT